MRKNQKIHKDHCCKRLCEMISNNDFDAFEYLYSQYSPILYGLALRTTGSKEYAQELVQNTFVNALRSIDLKDKNVSMNTWMIKNLMSELREFSNSQNIRFHSKDNNFDDLNFNFVFKT